MHSYMMFAIACMCIIIGAAGMFMNSFGWPAFVILGALVLVFAHNT